MTKRQFCGWRVSIQKTSRNSFAELILRDVLTSKDLIELFMGNRAKVVSLDFLNNFLLCHRSPRFPGPVLHDELREDTSIHRLVNTRKQKPLAQ